jgi:hypothetical protein
MKCGLSLKKSQKAALYIIAYTQRFVWNFLFSGGKDEISTVDVFTKTYRVFVFFKTVSEIIPCHSLSKGREKKLFRKAWT